MPKSSVSMRVDEGQVPPHVRSGSEVFSVGRNHQPCLRWLVDEDKALIVWRQYQLSDFLVFTSGSSPDLEHDSFGGRFAHRQKPKLHGPVEGSQVQLCICRICKPDFLSQVILSRGHQGTEASSHPSQWLNLSPSRDGYWTQSK